MVTHNDNGMARVTVTLDPEDIRLLDRLAAFEGSNRSAELRGLLAQVRPMIHQVVNAFELAARNRDQLDEAMVSASVSQLQGLIPEAEKLQRDFLGMVAKLEGLAAADADPDAPASNTGATK